MFDVLFKNVIVIVPAEGVGLIEAENFTLSVYSLTEGTVTNVKPLSL
jgi:hypothetical protein